MEFRTLVLYFEYMYDTERGVSDCVGGRGGKKYLKRLKFFVLRCKADCGKFETEDPNPGQYEALDEGGGGWVGGEWRARDLLAGGAHHGWDFPLHVYFPYHENLNRV